MLRAALMSHQRLLLSRAGSRVLRPSTTSTAAGLASRIAMPASRGPLQPPTIAQLRARSVSTLLHRPVRLGPLGAMAVPGRGMVLGGATCVLLAWGSGPASRQDWARDLFGPGAPEAPEYTDDDKAYREQLRAFLASLASHLSTQGMSEEEWRAGVRHLRALHQKAMDRLEAQIRLQARSGPDLRRRHCEAVLGTMPARRQRIDDATARVEAMYGKLVALTRTVCPPELLISMVGLAASLPEDRFDSSLLQRAGRCLEPALRLLHTEVKPAIKEMVADVQKARACLKLG